MCNYLFVFVFYVLLDWHFSTRLAFRSVNFFSIFSISESAATSLLTATPLTSTGLDVAPRGSPKEGPVASPSEATIPGRASVAVAVNPVEDKDIDVDEPDEAVVVVVVVKAVAAAVKCDGLVGEDGIIFLNAPDIFDPVTREVTVPKVLVNCRP